MSSYKNINVLLGKTLRRVAQKDGCEIFFETTEGKCYLMHHQQDCCESVSIEDINGDLQDLIGSPLLVAEEVTSNQVMVFSSSLCSEDRKKLEALSKAADSDEVAAAALHDFLEEHGLEELEAESKSDWDDSYTWTFYKLATVKGHVVIRWYGTSNGYYSESVDFQEIESREA